jgi:CheY-like chemotaxis protein
MPQGDGSTLIDSLKRNAETSSIPIVVPTARHDPGPQRQMEHIKLRLKPLDAV